MFEFTPLPEDIIYLNGGRYEAGKKKAWYDKNFPGKLLITVESGNLTKDAKAIIAANI